MPSYDYNCKNCDLEFETRHSMTEKPVVICPRCESRSTHKVPSLPGLVTRSGRNMAMDRAVDQVKRNAEMKETMRTELGIEKINPLGGATMTQVYQDAMAQKTQIKEQMSQQAETRKIESDKKRREWTKAALKRTPRRAKERDEHKAREAAAKRAIRL